MNLSDDDRTEQIIKAARLALFQMQPYAPITLRGVVHALRDDIKKARANGLRWEDIAEILRRSGCANVKAETVRSYHGVDQSSRSKKIANAQRREQQSKRHKDEAERPQSSCVAIPQSAEQLFFENEVSNRQQGISRPVKSSRIK